MIKGRKLSFDKRFGTEMGDFLGSTNCAIVTYIGSVTKIEGKMTDNFVIQFNYCDSISEYHNSLDSKFVKAKNELELMLAKTYNKYDKLCFINDIISEINSFIRFLKKNTDDSFTHKLYHFSNLSKVKKYQTVTIDESYCQEYYYWMIHYLEKMFAFLNNQLIINQYTNQDEFPIHHSMMPDVNSSTKEKPLEFFEFLFNRKGISNLRKNFIQSFDIYESADYKYDSQTETMICFHQEDLSSEWLETKKTFNDYFSSLLISEFHKSCKYIDDYISEQKKKSSINLYIKLNLSKLNNLLLSIEQDFEANKYENSSKPITGLIKFIHKNYFDFLPIKKVEEINAVEISDSIFTKKTTNYCFKIKAGASKKTKANSLFDALVIEKYVDIASKNDFINAFTGYQPKNKIIWIGNFGDLKTFINYCFSSSFIEKKSKKWVITSNIFISNEINFDSNQIRSTKETLSKEKIKNLFNSLKV